jgi:hypothetical protein
VNIGCREHVESESLVKFRKVNTLIRPVVSNCSATDYRIGEFITKFLTSILELFYSYGMKNSAQMMQINISSEVKMCLTLVMRISVSQSKELTAYCVS